MHFWAGSFCFLKDRGNVSFPSGIVAASDVITIVSDLGNKIPDRSWMLYLLELFNRQNIPLELNLICSFNDDGKFHAIFGGVNQHEFREVPALVGHSYRRQIIMNPKSNSIIYLLDDITEKKQEQFVLPIKENRFVFEGKNQFTGLEWWNKTGGFPYPPRFDVEISQLLHGKNDNLSDPESISYFPYNMLIPNKDDITTQYPVSFHQAKVKDNCLCYRISSGVSSTGLEYSF